MSGQRSSNPRPPKVELTLGGVVHVWTVGEALGVADELQRAIMDATRDLPPGHVPAGYIEHCGYEECCGPERPRPGSDQPDWTVSTDGRSNSSAYFLSLVDEVARMVSNARVGDSGESVARLILAQLAHVHGIVPRPSAASPDAAYLRQMQDERKEEGT